MSAFSLGVVALFGFLLPVMRLFAFADGQVNASAADALVFPVLFLVRRRLLGIGSLGHWLLALWLVNLLAWVVSASLLTEPVFARQCLTIAVCYVYALVGFAVGRELYTRTAFVRGLMWSAVPMAALGILAFFTGQPSSFVPDSRVSGTMNDANAFAIYLAVALPLVASLGLGWLATPLFAGAVVVSFSRSGLASMASALALGSLHLGPRRYLPILVGCIAAFILIYTMAGSTSSLGRRLVDYQESLEERQGLWSAAFEVAADHPVIGIGKGNWQAATGRRVLPHNTFLSVMVDSGLVGFVVFLLPLIVWVVRGMRLPAARPWAVAVCACLVGGMAVSLDNFRPFWLSIGVLAATLAAASPRAGVAVARAGLHSPRERHWS